MNEFERNVELARLSDASIAAESVSEDLARAWLHPRVDALRADIAFLPAPNLQRFAAEDEGRTEDPTDRRKREERDKGNVPKSQDVVSASVLLGTVITLFLLAGIILFQIMDLFRRYLTGEYAHLYNINQETIRQIVFELFWETAKITGPVFAVAMVLGIAGGVSQVGALFTLQPLAFKPERMKPDFKRILPVRRTMYNLLKVIVQVAILGSVAYVIISFDFIPALKTANMGLLQAVGLFAWISFKLLLVCAVVLLLLSVPDYFYQRFEYIENLKMTISEAKRERKDEEGDPLVRQRQRERGMELRRQGRMLEDVPAADVVITNPTHYAVALRYDPETSAAPMVIARGVDHLAFLIRTVARENEVPIQENPALARLLYSEVELGGEIPEHLFQAVSVIFARLDKFRAGAGVS